MVQKCEATAEINISYDTNMSSAETSGFESTLNVHCPRGRGVCPLKQFPYRLADFLDYHFQADSVQDADDKASVKLNELMIYCEKRLNQMNKDQERVK